MSRMIVLLSGSDTFPYQEFDNYLIILDGKNSNNGPETVFKPSGIKVKLL